MAGFKNRINVKTTNNYFERTELLEQYYKDVRAYDVFTAKEEKEIFTKLASLKKRVKILENEGKRIEALKVKKEADKVKDDIIKANLRLVISIARIYASNYNLLDLINEGNIGLMKAVDTFDVTLGNRFQTHAIQPIRQAINLYRQNDGLTIRKNNESKTFHIIANMTNKFIQEFNREPNTDELKDYINQKYPKIKIKDSADLLNIKITSIDTATDDDESDANIGNMQLYNSYSASNNSYEKISEAEHLSAFVNSLMRNLSERDRTIIKMHFGIEQFQNASCPVSEISEKVGLTPERVRQLITSIKEKLKEEYAKVIYQEY